ncbi:MAG: hypothetical protein DHS20C15_29150 [Planctomycetota bacterium]|nr:MAG: hypothetical protein DHS20C15_29150 [Planctomycetota bacterium]
MLLITLLAALLSVPMQAGAGTPTSAGGGASAAAAAMAQGQTLLNQGDVAGAIAQFESVIASNPQAPGAWYLLGFARHAKGDMEQALVAHLKAAELASNPAVKSGALYNAGCAYARQGKTDEAFASLNASIAAGLANLAQLNTDTDLVSLRSDPRWAALTPKIAPLRSASTFSESGVEILHEWRGETPGDFFGWVARQAGDLDGDGVVDAIVSAHMHKGGAGKAYAYSAKSGELLWSVVGKPGEVLGFGVVAIGDVNADGTPDVALGAPNNRNPQSPGRVLLCSGADGSLIHEIVGTQPGERFGSLFAGEVDLNGDGVLDLVVGATHRDGGAGAITVHSTDDGRELARFTGSAGDALGICLAASTDGPRPMLAAGASGAGPTGNGQMRVWTGWPLEAAYTLEADATGAAYGQYFTSFPGDFDKDGTPDLYSVDFSNGANGSAHGRAYLHSGADGSVLRTFTGKPGEGLGIGVAKVGDVDQDGTPDLLIGSWLCSDAANQGGRATLYSGSDGAVLQQFTNTATLDQFGYDTDGLGDVDGDGVPDFLVTSANSGVGGASTGRVFVLKGKPVRGE